MFRKQIIAILTTISLLFLSAFPAFAHVIVTPHQVGVGVTQDFVVNVPNEKDNPVTTVRLLMPNGLSSVTPYVATGWTIATKTNGSGDNATASEIDWSNGSIPAGQAEQLHFQAQAPAQQTTLNWKAYQTYSDGTVVSWDVDPATLKNMSDAEQDALADKQNKGEYSTTAVVNDLTGNTNSTNSSDSSDQVGIKDQFADWMSVLAVILSAGALYFSWRKK